MDENGENESAATSSAASIHSTCPIESRTFQCDHTDTDVVTEWTAELFNAVSAPVVSTTSIAAT